MKKIFLLTVLNLFVLAAAWAQPGYLGRKTFVNYSFFFSPEINALFDQGEFRFATKHTFDINQVVSRKDVIGGLFEFGNTSIYGYDYSYNGDEERIDLYDISFKGFGAAWYSYGGEKSVLAPLGNYWGIKAIYYLIDIESAYEGLDYKTSTSTFTPRLVFGKKKIWGHFTMDMSLEIDAAFWRWGAVFDDEGEIYADESSLEEAAIHQITQDYIFGLNIAVGYIFKSPLGK